MSRRHRIGNCIVLSKPVTKATGAVSGGVQSGKLIKNKVESIFADMQSPIQRPI